MDTANLQTLLERSIALNNEHLQKGDKPSVQGNGDVEFTDSSLTFSVHRPIEQLEQQSHRLSQETSRGRDYSSESRAQVLLSGRGFDTKRISETLQAIDVAQAFEPMQPLEDTDVQGFLRHQHELLLISTIEDMRNQTRRDSDLRFEAALHAEWERSKRSIFESLNHDSVDNNSMEGLESSRSSFPGQAATYMSASVNSQRMLEKARIYGLTVCAINDIRVQNRCANVASMFESAFRTTPNISDSEAVASSWSVLKSVLGESNVVDSPFTPSRGSKLQSAVYTGLTERAFAQAYSRPYGDPDGIVLRKKILHGSRSWLETYFCQFVDAAVFSEVRKDDPSASVQRLPLGLRVEIWARERLVCTGLSSGWETVDGLPFWAIIFYLIRCGGYKDSLAFASRFEKYLCKTEPRFLEYLASWVTSSDFSLPKKVQSQILADFNNRIRDGILRNGSSAVEGGLLSSVVSSPVDPYKYLIFRILGGIVLDDNSIPSAVTSSLAGGSMGWEDELWFQLMLAREWLADDDRAPSAPTSSYNTSSSDSARFSLRDIYHQFVSKHSVTHWTGNGKKPFRYFSALILVGEFERAIQFLWTNGLEVDALHFSIALAYYGLLRIPRDVDSLESDISYVDNNFIIIHFAQMLRLYFQRISSRASNPELSMHYCFFLCIFEDGYIGSQVEKSVETAQSLGSTCRNLLIEIVLETGEIDLYFGSSGGSLISPESYRSSGLIEKYLPLIRIHGWQEFRMMIVLPAAKKAERLALSFGRRFEIDKSGVLVNADSEIMQQKNNAILLYNLAEEYNCVLDIMIRNAGTILSKSNFEAIASSTVQTLSSSIGSDHDLGNAYDLHLKSLQDVDEMVQQTIRYYESQPHIANKLNKLSLKTLYLLSGLSQFHRSVIIAFSAFTASGASHGSLIAFKGRIMSKEVSQQMEWRRGLSILNDLSLLPFNIADDDAGLEESFSTANAVVGTPFKQYVLGTPRPSSAVSGGKLSSSKRTHVVESTGMDFDYSLISSRAENIRREISDAVLAHLPSVLLGAELLMLLGWHEHQSAATMDSKFDTFCRRSRQILLCSSAIARWFKLSAETHRLLVSMDEFMSAH